MKTNKSQDTHNKNAQTYDVAIYGMTELDTSLLTVFDRSPPKVYVYRFRITGELIKARTSQAMHPLRFAPHICTALTWLPWLSSGLALRMIQHINAVFEGEHPELFISNKVNQGHMVYDEDAPMEILQYRTVDDAK